MDDLEEIGQNLLERVILGLTLAGLVGGALVWAIAGPDSFWFLRCLALLDIAVVTFIVRQLGYAQIAAYLLLVLLMGLVAELPLEVTWPSQLTSYLFIPIIIIASLIITPAATLYLGLATTLVTLLITILTGQVTPQNYLYVLLALGLLLVTTLLAAESSVYRVKLGRRLDESGQVLRDRTLEMLKIQDQIKSFEVKINRLTEQLAQAKNETNQAHWQATQKDNRLHNLITGTIRESKGAVKTLEQTLTQLAETSKNSLRTDLFQEVWPKLDHLTSLTLGMEQVLQLEDGEIQLSLQPVDLALLLSDLVNAARVLAQAKNIEIRYTAANHLPAIEADPERLRQALLQLLGNAIKFTHQGLVEVQTELAETEILVYISDTGVGMSKDELHTLFQDFGKRKAANHPHHGPGIGLILAKRLLELHRGRIWASSILGIGSTFGVALPLPAIKSNGLAAEVVNHLPLATVSPQKMVVVPVLASTSTDPEATMISSMRVDGPIRVESTLLPAKSLSEHSSAGRSRSSAADRLASVEPIVETGIATFKSSPPAAPVTTNFSPVARFSPRYITRFGLILLGLLVAVSGLVCFLAWWNGPVAPPTPPSEVTTSPASTATQAELAQITATALTIPSATPTPLPSTLVTTQPIPPVQPTFTVAVLPNTPTLSPSPIPATSTPRPTQTSTPSPSPIPPTATLRPTQTPTHTPSPVPASPTPRPTQTPTPTFSPEPPAQLQPKITLTVQPTPTQTTKPTATAQPPQLDLSFLAKQRFSPAITVLESAFGKLAARVGETANGPLNWWGDAALFSNAGPGDQELYLARAGETVNLSPAKGDDLQPAWSPDGQTVAFSSARNGNFDIYLLACPKLAGNCAGNKPIQLTSSRGYDEWPAWSPNGQKIAFVSDRDGNVEIYVMDASGANQQRLSQHPADDWPATWSPDGRSLAFASNRDGNWNIYLMAPNGENIRRLTNDPGDEREPVWSPDGQRLAFAANKNGNWDIYTLLVPLNQPTEVPSTAWSHVAATATDERYPAWLP